MDLIIRCCLSDWYALSPWASLAAFRLARLSSQLCMQSDIDTFLNTLWTLLDHTSPPQQSIVCQMAPDRPQRVIICAVYLVFFGINRVADLMLGVLQDILGAEPLCKKA